MKFRIKVFFTRRRRGAVLICQNDGVVSIIHKHWNITARKPVDWNIHYAPDNENVYCLGWRL